MSESSTEPSWVEPTHRAIVEAGITVVGYVPDGGLSHLIERLVADRTITTVRLTTEEEGVALAAGAWLGGARASLLMQSSGVGNCTNMLGMLQTCRMPALLLVTMRGEDGESNPWQLPMGRATAPTLELMGVDVRRASSGDDVAAAVSRACTDAFNPNAFNPNAFDPNAVHPTAGGVNQAQHEGPVVAVLVEQQVFGAKTFAGDR